MSDQKPARGTQTKKRAGKPGEKHERIKESRDPQTRDRLSFDELIDQYLEQDDQRNNTRKKWRAQVTITMPSKDVTRVIRTDAVDLSRSGYSFRTYRDVPYGSVVKTEITLGKKVFKISAIVRHCTRVSERDYQVGVQFEDVTRRYIGFNGRKIPVESTDAREELFNAVDAAEENAAPTHDQMCPSCRNSMYA